MQGLILYCLCPCLCKPPPPTFTPTKLHPSPPPPTLTLTKLHPSPPTPDTHTHKTAPLPPTPDTHTHTTAPPTTPHHPPSFRLASDLKVKAMGAGSGVDSRVAEAALALRGTHACPTLTYPNTFPHRLARCMPFPLQRWKDFANLEVPLPFAQGSPAGTPRSTLQGGLGEELQ